MGLRRRHPDLRADGGSREEREPRRGRHGDLRLPDRHGQISTAPQATCRRGSRDRGWPLLPFFALKKRGKRSHARAEKGWHNAQMRYILVKFHCFCGKSSRILKEA